MQGLPTRRELATLLRLSGPLVIVNVGHQLMGLVDTALAGRVDTVTLAAVGLGNTLYFFIAVFGMGVVMAVDPLASQAYGAGRERHARRAMWQGVWAGLATVPFVVAVNVALAAGLEGLGINPGLAATTRAYIHARLPSLPFFFILVAQRTYLQAAHRTAPLVASTVAANLFNFGAAWVLLFGEPRLGLPPLGAAGLGIATSAATLLQCVWLAFSVRRLSAGEGAEPVRRLDPALLRTIFRLGIPIGLQFMAEGGIFTVVGFLAGRMGDAQMAAHQVAISFAALTFMVPLAVGTATSVQVGRAVGAGDAEGVRRSGAAGFFLGGGFMAGAALVLALFAEPVARLMTLEAQVVPIAAGLLRIAAVFQLFDGIQAVGSGALRGAGVTRWAMIANVVAYWVVGFPVSAWLGLILGLGPHGLWWGLTVGLAVAAAALVAKFVATARRPIVALEPRETS